MRQNLGLRGISCSQILGSFTFIRKTLFSWGKGASRNGGPAPQLITPSFDSPLLEKQANSKPSKYIADSSYLKALDMHIIKSRKNKQLRPESALQQPCEGGSASYGSPHFTSEDAETQRDKNFIQSQTVHEDWRGLHEDSHHHMSKFQYVMEG